MTFLLKYNIFFAAIYQEQQFIRLGEISGDGSAGNAQSLSKTRVDTGVCGFLPAFRGIRGIQKGSAQTSAKKYRSHPHAYAYLPT